MIFIKKSFLHCYSLMKLMQPNRKEPAAASALNDN